MLSLPATLLDGRAALPFTAEFKSAFIASAHVRPKSVAVELYRVSCSLGWIGPARPLSQISRREEWKQFGRRGRGARKEVDLLDNQSPLRE